MGARAKRACCAAAVVAVAAFAGLGAGRAAAADAPYIDWTPLLPGLSLGFKPSDERDCADGSNACIERTLASMYRRFDRLYATCDHNSVFALVYIRVTEAIRRELLRGYFAEPTFLNHEDAVFARMYFNSFDQWERGQLERVPGAWREAFDAARDKRVNAFGNLLMSMNAHVNRDMPFMLAGLGLQQPGGASRKPDHDRGNLLLSRLLDDTIEEVAQRWDPTTRNYDLPLGTIDDMLSFQILPLWREGVWRNAELLRLAGGAGGRRAVSNLIEGYGAGTGRFIRVSTGINGAAARDAHCRRYRATHHERGAEAYLAARSLRARRGRVSLRMACPPGIRDCDGIVGLELARRGRPVLELGRTPLPGLGPRGVERVGVRLSRGGRRLLRAAGRRGLGVRVAVHTRTPWGRGITRLHRTRLR
jgi:hypothetical protein